MSDLNAVNLKAALWDTLQKLRTGEVEPHVADSIAVQGREIVRTTRVQLSIIDKAKCQVSDELIDFAVPKSARGL